MSFSELDTIYKLSNIVVENSDIQQVINSVKVHLYSSLPLKDFHLFFYDASSRKLKDVNNNFTVVEDLYSELKTSSIYNSFIRLNNCDYIINNCETMVSSLKDSEEIIAEELVIPLKGQDGIIGIAELVFDSQMMFKVSILKLLSILSNQFALLIQNKLMNDRLQINSDFYDALKNIAKIIETQYELNYIIPLIGEMIDKFVSNHLIYIFIKQRDSFNLFWPSACNDSKIYELINKIGKSSNFLVSENKKIGVFPLLNNKEVLGCIVARSTIDKLSQKEIEYLVQLTKQSSITIDRANVYAEVLKHATLDALTGLNNRRQFEIRLKQEYASAIRQKHSLCAMMIDIDFFKKINDTYGHSTGDKVLKTVAKVIQNQLREYDIPSRYGGEEFCILLPQTRIEEANIVAQRLRLAIEKTNIESCSEKYSQNKNISVTISIGLAQLKEPESGEDLYNRADKALYEAKTRGRNRVIVYYD